MRNLGRREALAGLVLAPSGQEVPGNILSKNEAEVIARKVLDFADPSADTVVNVQLSNVQNTRFARNEITTQLDAAVGQVTVTVMMNGRTATGVTQRFDDDGLMEAVRWAEEAVRDGPGEHETSRLIQPMDYPVPPGLWSEASSAVEVEGRVAKLVDAIQQTEGYVSAGTLDLNLTSMLVANSAGLVGYCRSTTGSLSMSARTSDNTGSGWAGKAIYDFGGLDPVAVAGQATDKAERSKEPSAIEPGRYTVILEPDAYAQMVFYMMRYHMDLEGAQSGFSVFAGPEGTTKIGQRVFDERLSFVSDPIDPAAPFCPFNGVGSRLTGPIGSRMECFELSATVTVRQPNVGRTIRWPTPSRSGSRPMKEPRFPRSRRW